MTPEAYCQKCRFFLELEGASGECRRFPPNQTLEDAASFWPEVEDADWCGEFVAAPAADSGDA